MDDIINASKTIVFQYQQIVEIMDERSGSLKKCPESIWDKLKRKVERENNTYYIYIDVGEKKF